MYIDNDPIKPGFVFFKSDLCAVDYARTYPIAFQVSRRGGYGYFCKIEPADLVNGCEAVTADQYVRSQALPS